METPAPSGQHSCSACSKHPSIRDKSELLFSLATDAITRSCVGRLFHATIHAVPPRPLKPRGRVLEVRAGGSSIIFGTRFSSSARKISFQCQERSSLQLDVHLFEWKGHEEKKKRKSSWWGSCRIYFYSATPEIHRANQDRCEPYHFLSWNPTFVLSSDNHFNSPIDSGNLVPWPCRLLRADAVFCASLAGRILSSLPLEYALRAVPVAPSLPSLPFAMMLRSQNPDGRASWPTGHDVSPLALDIQEPKTNTC